MLRKPLMASVVGASAVYAYDTHFNSRALQRNLRTFYTAARVALDYKLNFYPGQSYEQLEAIHLRSATRVYDLCITNGGLYIKLGQGLALQSAVLPPSFNRVFSVLYDSAPVVPFSVVEAIIEQDLGKPIHELFASFDPEPVASASIAQVHKARLLDGREVAVKVQKPDILPQLDWDLYSYRIVLSLFEYVFELPVTWTCDYTEKHLRQETDFLHEASNAEQARLDLTPFNTSVYIPAVDWSRTSKRVMTSEWMDGVRITERDTIEGEYGFSMEQVVAQAVDLFAFQIFESGFVHCDPHPGNLLVRPNPANPKVPQLVLLDHGLYAIERPEFKYEYALFWKSLFLNDQKTLVDITRSWGIHDVDLFASATLMRPFSSTKTPLHLGQKVTKTDVYEMQMAAKARAQKFFQDTHLLPRELILVGRNMNIIRAINKELGSPVNRIARMVQWAVRGLGAHAWQQSTRTPTTPWQLRKWFSIRFESLRFRLALWALSAAFYWIKVTEWLKQTWLPSTRARGFEQILDDHMSRVVEQEMGIPVDVTAFNA